MRFLMAGILAAGVSWVGNRAALKVLGTKVIVILGPLLEELVKSWAAVLARSSLVLTHGTFGFIECIYDTWNSGRQGVLAGMTSLLGHLFFGYATDLVWRKFEILGVAILAGYSLHMLWNITVMNFIVIKRRTNK